MQGSAPKTQPGARAICWHVPAPGLKEGLRAAGTRGGLASLRTDTRAPSSAGGLQEPLRLQALHWLSLQLEQAGATPAPARLLPLSAAHRPFERRLFACPQVRGPGHRQRGARVRAEVVLCRDLPTAADRAGRAQPMTTSHREAYQAWPAKDGLQMSLGVQAFFFSFWSFVATRVVEF